MLSVSIYTLGCKLNQLESEALADSFIRRGFSLLPWEDMQAQPNIVIINTCTVTSRSDQKARRVIRKSLLENPGCCVIVTGCYAKLDREKIAALDGAGESPPGSPNCRRLFVIGDKSRLLDLPAFLRGEIDGESSDAHNLASLIAACLEKEAVAHDAGDALENAGAFCYKPEQFSFHTRGFLKIQDGCDNHCTYCRIRFARGPSVSMPADLVLAELQALEDKGYWEAVLTGVNISQYSQRNFPCHEASPGASQGLGGLLSYLLNNTRSIGLRLSSLEPEFIDRDFAAVLAHPRIRPHFHLSVQSGSAPVLRKMGRAYTGETVGRCVSLLRSVKRNPFIACDIITGFPGETESDFEETFALCRDAGFAWIHAFPYSKRPGTAAAAFPQTVTEREAAARVEKLIALAVKARQDYASAWIGAEVEALVEKGDGNTGGYCRGLSENYLRLLIQYPDGHVPEAGTVLRCKITELAVGEQGNNSADALALGLK